jgi:phosphopantothenoylcysteine decarboxylase/phosphopantothenate--cysteine ligase
MIAAMSSLVYLMVSGAISAHRVSEIVAALRLRYERVLTVQTPNSTRVVSPLELSRVPGNAVVSGYFDPQILPRPAAAPVLFAPCTFNSLNQLAAGQADNLALAITAEMIGYGQRVTVGISVNEPLFAHPIVRRSIETLRSWGVHVVEPRDVGRGLTLAPVEELIAGV